MNQKTHQKALASLFIIAAAIIAAAALYGLIWLAGAFMHDLFVPTHQGWKYILFTFLN